MGEQVILSISLLASNRKETVRKCLDSLKPIMEEVPSELIIVDTGCDGKTRDILKEYTNHIVPSGSGRLYWPGTIAVIPTRDSIRLCWGMWMTA